MNKIISVFPNSDLRCSHFGLGMKLIKAKKDPVFFRNGNFALFLNRSQTAFKILGANNVLVHYKHPRGRVNVKAIKFIPECFHGGEFTFDRALAKVIDKELTRKRG